MFHLDLDLRVHVYALYIWYTKSTPPMFWLYSLADRGQLKSAWLLSIAYGLPRLCRWYHIWYLQNPQAFCPSK